MYICSITKGSVGFILKTKACSFRGSVIRAGRNIDEYIDEVTEIFVARFSEIASTEITQHIVDSIRLLERVVDGSDLHIDINIDIATDLKITYNTKLH